MCYDYYCLTDQEPFDYSFPYIKLHMLRLPFDFAQDRLFNMTCPERTLQAETIL